MSKDWDPLKIELKRELEKYKLSPKAKDVLVEDAAEYFEKIAPEIKIDNFLKRKIALKLACDANACAINPMFSKGMGHLAKAREVTGVKQVFDPTERVGAQVKMLKNVSYIPEKATEAVEKEATKIIRAYQEKTGKMRASLIPYIDSAAAIYLAGIITGNHVTQRELYNLFGVGEATLRKVYGEYADTLKLKIIL